MMMTSEVIMIPLDAMDKQIITRHPSLGIAAQRGNDTSIAGTVPSAKKKNWMKYSTCDRFD